MKRGMWVAALAMVLGASAARADEALPAIDMVRVPAGCFQMGSQAFEKHERPVHKVCLKGFEIGRVEVTQAQWRAVMGSNPSKFEDCGPDCPVDRVSWNQAQEFIGKLNERGPKGYRLPSEAEWEYACRSGGKDEIWPGAGPEGSTADLGWFDKDVAGNRTHPVGKKKANGVGLHDMAGNVWEWVQDRFVSPYPVAPENNPVIESGGENKRVMRGGSWGGKLNYVRCGIRARYEADYVDSAGRVGLRLARDLP